MPSFKRFFANTLSPTDLFLDGAVPFPGAKFRFPVTNAPGRFAKYGQAVYDEKVVTILALVASHKTVDLETVAHLANGASVIPTSIAQKSVKGTVVLSTCNRLEIYAELSTNERSSSELIDSRVELASHVMFDVIAEEAGLELDLVHDSFELLTDEQAAHHLFTVASGLESAVVGEREITGQVRRASASAQEAGYSSANLVRLFDRAAFVARQVGQQTALGSRGRSVVSVALDLAHELAAKDWSSRSALIFGTGAYAGAAVAALTERGCTSIAVYSRSNRAETFAAKRGVRPISSEDLAAEMEAADIIIGCSGGSEPMPAEQIPAGHHVILDLALSHDFAPEVAELPNVDLITLETVRLAAPDETVESVETARRIVATSTQEFASQEKARDIDSAIVALRKHTLDILDHELEKVRSTYGCGAAAEQVEMAMRRMVNSLLHTPMVRARSLAQEGRETDYISALEALYGIQVEETQAGQEAEDNPHAKAS